MPVNGTLKEMVETTYDLHRSGLASGYIQELETSIEVRYIRHAVAPDRRWQLATALNAHRGGG